MQLELSNRKLRADLEELNKKVLICEECYYLH